MTSIIWVSGALLLGACAVFLHLVRSRNLQYWLYSYCLWQCSRLFRRKVRVRHVYFCFADHYEPYGGGADRARARERVRHWIERYPRVASRHRDSFGNSPKHTFFYPAEEYDAELLDQIRQLCERRLGDVEIHLHHDNDAPDNLRGVITRYAAALHERHGLLRKDPATGKILYCFIHGNWALDNSSPDGRLCGVDNEIGILADTGCCADMTMPSAPSDTQTRKINSIYFSRGRPGRRKSHDSGRDVRVGRWGDPGELLLIQGPLTLNWKDAKYGLLPKIESAELSSDAPPTPHRVRLWGNCGICVRGAEEHVFIKVHTHGATEESMQMLFAESGFERLWGELERQYRRDDGGTLRYVTAWEMYSKIRELATCP